MNEIWKDVEGFNGYQVSNIGNVRSLDRFVLSKDGKLIPKHGRVLQPIIDVDGYRRVHITNDDGKRKIVKISRLVAKAFIPNPNDYPVVNHKDLDRTNDKCDNLEWCTVYYNNTYNNINHIKAARRLFAKRIAMLSKDTNKVIKVFDCITDAALYLGNKKFIAYISKAAHVGTWSAYGYMWKFV